MEPPHAGSCRFERTALDCLFVLGQMSALIANPGRYVGRFEQTGRPADAHCRRVVLIKHLEIHTVKPHQTVVFSFWT